MWTVLADAAGVLHDDFPRVCHTVTILVGQTEQAGLTSSGLVQLAYRVEPSNQIP